MRRLCGSSHETCRCADHAGREADEAEHDVLDAGLQVALAARRHLAGTLAGQGQDQRQVVRREAPERVLVLAHLAEVLAVRVQVEHPAERAVLRQLLHLRERGWKRSRWPTISCRSCCVGERDQVGGVLDRQRQRLLDEQVLAGLEHLRADRMVRGGAGRDDDRVERVIGQQVVEPVGEPRARELRAKRARWPRRGRSTRRDRSRGRGRGCAPGSGPSSRARRRRRGGSELVDMAASSPGAGRVAEVDDQRRQLTTRS